VFGPFASHRHRSTQLGRFTDGPPIVAGTELIISQNGTERVWLREERPTLAPRLRLGRFGLGRLGGGRWNGRWGRGVGSGIGSRSGPKKSGRRLLSVAAEAGADAEQEKFAEENSAVEKSAPGVTLQQDDEMYFPYEPMTPAPTPDPEDVADEQSLADPVSSGYALACCCSHLLDRYLSGMFPFVSASHLRFPNSSQHAAFFSHIFLICQCIAKHTQSSARRGRGALHHVRSRRALQTIGARLGLLGGAHAVDAGRDRYAGASDGGTFSQWVSMDGRMCVCERALAWLCCLFGDVKICRCQSVLSADYVFTLFGDFCCVSCNVVCF
jgi:hypothetical protein